MSDLFENASIKPEELKVRDDLSARVARHAVTSTGIRSAARVSEAVAQNNLDFDIDLKQGERTNQERSGRCWMFAALNTFRYEIIKKYDLASYELSQAYTLFYDKLEKSNWFLLNMIDTVDEPLNSRLVSYLLFDPISDGGQWDMLAALIEKYGLVPKEAMPETACSKCTSEMDSYLTRMLRSFARDIRSKHEAGATTDELQQLRREMMDKVYNYLCTCLGVPPTNFEVRLRDKNGELKLSGSYTPQSFWKEVGQDLSHKVSIISAPTSDKPFGRSYTVSRLGNVAEKGSVRHLNLPIERLKELAVAQMKDGHPVWFGCDVIQSYLKDEGIMDTAALDVDALFNTPIEGALNRAERLDYGESLMTHAMVFEGVRFDGEGKTSLWKVENSWGKDHGRNGFDTISDAWFDEYVYQVVVDDKYLSDEERAAYAADPIVLDPWDPMGSLAR